VCVCVSVALIIQHAKSMRRIILLSVACLVLPFFPHYLINGTIFGRKLWNTKCVFWFSLQLLSETFLVLRITEGNIKINARLHLVYPIFLSDINIAWIFSTDFRKILKYQISWKSVQWEPRCSIRAETVRLIVAFRNFANAPKVRKRIPGQ
jgi:hypothetical protein